MIHRPFISSLKKASVAGLIAVYAVIAFTHTASAIPALQVYIEGASYDDADESWKITSPSNVPLASGPSVTLTAAAKKDRLPM